MKLSEILNAPFGEIRSLLEENKNNIIWDLYDENSKHNKILQNIYFGAMIGSALSVIADLIIIENLDPTVNLALYQNILNAVQNMTGFYIASSTFFIIHKLRNYLKARLQYKRMLAAYDAINAADILVNPSFNFAKIVINYQDGSSMTSDDNKLLKDIYELLELLFTLNDERFVEDYSALDELACEYAACHPLTNTMTPADEMHFDARLEEIKESIEGKLYNGPVLKRAQ